MANHRKNEVPTGDVLERAGSTSPKKLKGTRNFMQCLCAWCGHQRRQNNCGYQCRAVRIEVRLAIKQYARANGRSWRRSLVTEWERACSGIVNADYRQLLQEARNVIGPSRLYKVEV